MAKMNTMTPGQAAYEAWVEEWGGRDYDEWDELTESHQCTWEGVADAAISAPGTGAKIMVQGADGFMIQFDWPGGAVEADVADDIRAAVEKVLAGGSE